MAAGSAWVDSNLVFTKETGQPIHPTLLLQQFKRHCRDAGVPLVRIHDLRVTTLRSDQR
jgi:hypothetical protein